MALLYNKLLREGLPEEAAQSQVDELKDADVLSGSIKSLKQGGLVLMLCGDWEKDLEQAKSSEEALKHIVLAFLKDQKVSASFATVLLSPLAPLQLIGLVCLALHLRSGLGGV